MLNTFPSKFLLLRIIQSTALFLFKGKRDMSDMGTCNFPPPLMKKQPGCDSEQKTGWRTKVPLLLSSWLFFWAFFLLSCMASQLKALGSWTAWSSDLGIIRSLVMVCDHMATEGICELDGLLPLTSSHAVSALNLRHNELLLLSYNLLHFTIPCSRAVQRWVVTHLSSMVVFTWLHRWNKSYWKKCFLIDNILV